MREDIMPVIPPRELLNMYASGVFPMAENKGSDIMLFSPDPRTIIIPEEFHISHSLRKLWNSGIFEIRMNISFEEVMRRCAEREETWISEDLIRSYTALHRLGYAHSVEAWKDGTLAGGLYGVAMGGAFFGESMFFLERDASKIALVALIQRMLERGMPLLDVQYTTAHLKLFGSNEISRHDYLAELARVVDMTATFHP